MVPDHAKGVSRSPAAWPELTGFGGDSADPHCRQIRCVEHFSHYSGREWSSPPTISRGLPKRAGGQGEDDPTTSKAWMDACQRLGCSNRTVVIEVSEARVLHQSHGDRTGI